MSVRFPLLVHRKNRKNQKRYKRKGFIKMAIVWNEEFMGKLLKAVEDTAFVDQLKAVKDEAALVEAFKGKGFDLNAEDIKQMMKTIDNMAHQTGEIPDEIAEQAAGGASGASILKMAHTFFSVAGTVLATVGDALGYRKDDKWIDK
jgi:predicted ribosomally synthesized peptide with nif11-like leader